MTFLRMLHEVAMGLVIYNSFAAFILLVPTWVFIISFCNKCIITYTRKKLIGIVNKNSV